ncbi:MAG TPA: Asp-tRNA(Asn)/Glu-tRNA(Gln) amidotransferase subunit GatB [Myxococcaceae bacterium]|nr:Asp-tRNA(Asn)/Glu-tRNA(Gln) amidotransferase subunit GatB [Myxococcaceae bacterium]
MSASDFQPVIGLEVHAQLLTQSKIFCGCSTAFGAPPNHHTCPVCLGMPGVLPVLNEKVVELAVRVGLALGCRIRPVSLFARKNYFYPDLPKGYQISQYDQPICEDGKLEVQTASGERTVRIRRAHLEEDAGKSVHDAGGESLVDLNRAGVPLLEIVSEPDLRSSEEAAEYLRTMRDVLVYLGVNDGNLEEGSFRCDANVSVMRKGATEYGTRAELKNINSFRFVQKAIDFEIERQVGVIEGGGKVVQETRLYDPQRDETRSMRGKEEAHDYRYFPEPDLPPVRVGPALLERVRASLPELPRARVLRLQQQHGLSAADARTLCGDRALADFYEAAVPGVKDPKKLANWMMGDLLRQLHETGAALGELKFSPAQLAALVSAVEQGTISGAAGKDVLGEMFRTGKDPQAIIAEKGLAQVSDTGAMEQVLDELLAKNAGEVEKYKAGKKQVLGFLMGQAMKAMKGKGNPQLLNELLRKKLGEP